jgi:beta-carotene ketolase (CrtW type)
MSTLTVPQNQDDRLTGLVWAIAILTLWSITLVGICITDLSNLSFGWATLTILGRAFLQTGLFVIAHDAMHGNLTPQNRRLNDVVGAIAVSLYAGLSYPQCRINHALHHCHPAQRDDPDFHDGVHVHPLHWYVKFLQSYVSVRSISFVVLLGSLLILGFHRSMIQFMLFGLLPLILSSVQLFFFGTYLPHRQEALPQEACVPSAILRLWSFLSCYHFGCFHQEHHQYPQTPWYRLPQGHENDKKKISETDRINYRNSL